MACAAASSGGADPAPCAADDTRKCWDYLLNQPEEWRGKFPTGISKTPIEWAEYTARQLPGAADYDVHKSVSYLRTDGWADEHCGRFGKSVRTPSSRWHFPRRDALCTWTDLEDICRLGVLLARQQARAARLRR